MILIGYRMLFGELCTLLNVHLDPDADYVEDDFARETLIKHILQSIKHADLAVLVLSDYVYYLGLSVETCKNAFPPIMTSRTMSEQIARYSIKFQQELKKVGLFKHLDNKALKFTDPCVIQCEKIHVIAA
jgi:hypothetical protein